LVRAGFKGTLGPPKLATVLHRLSVLSKAHTLREAPNPVRDVQVQELIRSVRRAHAQRGELSQPKQALTKDPLEAMLATCGKDLIGVRDRALLLFAWASGGRRRSEVTAAVMEQLVAIDERTYLYRLLYSKTDPTGATRHVEKPIMGVLRRHLPRGSKPPESRKAPSFGVFGAPWLPRHWSPKPSGPSSSDARSSRDFPENSPPTRCAQNS